MPGEKIALFGGSFDPPHNGHINIMVSLLEEYQFSKVLVIPTSQNPLKTHFSEAKHRKKMCDLAFSHFPGVSILDYEMRDEGGAHRYSIDTVSYLQSSQFHDEMLFFVIGSDCISSIHLWKNPSDLFQRVFPFIVLRWQEDVEVRRIINDSPLSKNLKEILNKGIITGIPRYDISSTEVRKRVKNGFWISHMLPHNIESYIRMHKLYTEHVTK